MEMSQRTPCIAILNKQKCHFFSFTKLEKRTGPVWGVGSSGRGDKRDDEEVNSNMVYLI
jgi:hypothetical protein